VNFPKEEWGYGIMACRDTCNDDVQKYWEQQPQERANSWGFGAEVRDNKGNIKPETTKYPVRVSDYANTKTGEVTDPKKAMYRGAMYYAILRDRVVRGAEKTGGIKKKDAIARAFAKYNDEAYSKDAMKYYDQMTDLANKTERGKHGEFWDKGNLKQKKGQDLATGLANAPAAVWDDVKSTWRNLGSPSDRQSGKGTIMRAIDQTTHDKKRPGDWDFGWDEYLKSIGEPIRQGWQDATDTVNKGWSIAKPWVGKVTPQWVDDLTRRKENNAIIAQQKKDAIIAQQKKEKKESIEESTEQEILAKFAKEVLGLDISDEQMQQVIQRLDITDVVGIKRAIESGNFEGLRLGESRLKEYHSNKGMADRAKQARAMKEPIAQVAGQPLAPREPKKIAGNNPNPEAPPTGASNSTRKPVPSMPKSQIAKNLIVTDPDTGEELNVTNDLAATQMMRRAKRVG
jgi:hypothetical protein